MRKFIITEIDGQWEIEQIEVSGIFPLTIKNSARDMVARLMQLVEVGPVAPQTTPEVVHIGAIETNDRS